jgi:6,7-dimethyl-8-ribityllumazine synthase
MGEKGKRGSLRGKGLRVGVIVARYNQDITEKLLEGALAKLEEHGAIAEPVAWVPGSIEIPVAAQALADSGNVDAIVALGCVIKGETAHFEYVSAQTSRGLMDVALESGVPCAFGVLTVYDRQQAEARLDKGAEAAETAIEMANLLKELRGPS